MKVFAGDARKADSGPIPSIAPWRTVRLFFYGTLGAGALIGGLITLAGTAAALQGARPDLDLGEQVGQNSRGNVQYRHTRGSFTDRDK
jgi:hypothetical protein